MCSFLPATPMRSVARHLAPWLHHSLFWFPESQMLRKAAGACEPCACGEAAGAGCAALVSVFKDGTCGGILGSITLTTSEPGCLDLPSGSPLGSKTASFSMDQPGTCAPTGGEPAGSFEPMDPMTLCCEPDAEPAQ